jgi:hypothetical protein
MSSGYRASCLLVLVPLFSLGTGCRGEQPYGVVEGAVTLDGQPLTNVEVVFLPDPEKGTTGRRSVALADKEGRYRIASDTGRPGAPVGFHRVCINDMLAGPPGVAPPVTPEDNAKGPAGTKEEAKEPTHAKRSRFPAAYSSTIATPFRDIEVKEGTQTINLELKRERPR